jgi:hypothetical protein
MVEDLTIIIDAGNYQAIVCGEGEGDQGIRLAEVSKGTMWEDLYDPPVETIYNSTAFQIGGDYAGMKEGMLEFQLAFKVRPSRDRIWRFNESRFRKALSYKQDIKLRVKIGSTHRWLNVRLRKNPKVKVIVDPNKIKYGLMLCTFVAAYPRWLENDTVDQFVTETDTTASGIEEGALWVSNPTDQEIWLRFVTQGTEGIVWHLPDHSFGDDRYDRAVEDEDRMVQMCSLIDGEHVKVDTSDSTKGGQVVSSIDTEVYQRMGGKEFLYPVPAYTPRMQLPVFVENAPIGAGIQVRCPRTWTRPYGLE